MTLLTIAQDAASQLGLRRPVAIVGSTDLTAQLLLRFANQAGKDLVKYHEWQSLVTERTFTTVAAQLQTGAIPDDFDRMVWNVEIWNRTLSTRYSGPTNQRSWQQLQIGVSGGQVGWWRLKGGQLYFYPAASAGQTAAFEYVSNAWVEDANGNMTDHFLNDTDEPVFDEELMILELVWRYRHSRGFAQYAEDMETCMIYREKAAGQDRGTGRIRPQSTDSTIPPGPIWDGTVTP